MGENHGLNFPYEIQELTPEEKDAILKLYKENILYRCLDTLSCEINVKPPCIPGFITIPKDFVAVGPKKYKILRPYSDDAANIYNMPLRDSDVFVITYQRSGTTWTQELVWLLSNNLDYETAAKVYLTERYTFLDMFWFFNKKWQEEFLNSHEDKQMALEVIQKVATPVSKKLLTYPSPRFIKTHLPLSLMPPSLLDTSKVVYVARDPRDVAVSSYHHSRLFKVLHCPSPFKDFWNLFIKDLFTLTPYFEHVKEAWNQRHHPNMLFLFYEELSQDLPKTIRRVAEFLGKAVTDEQVSRLCDHLSIENFKNNQSVNFEEIRQFGMLATEEKFIRKGKAGGWRDYFDEEMVQQADRWIEENLRDTDLRFPNM